MNKIREFFSSKSMKVASFLTLAICAVMGSAFATDAQNATMASIATTTVNELTTVQQALLNLISQILPVALVVMGSVLVVTLGIRLFRRFAG